MVCHSLLRWTTFCQKCERLSFWNIKAHALKGLCTVCKNQIFLFPGTRKDPGEPVSKSVVSRLKGFRESGLWGIHPAEEQRRCKPHKLRTYGWFILRFDRKQQNSIKQLSFNNNKKKGSKIPEFPIPCRLGVERNGPAGPDYNINWSNIWDNM